jgi:cytochrome c peroxidase
MRRGPRTSRDSSSRTICGAIAVAIMLAGVASLVEAEASGASDAASIDERLAAALKRAGFSGRIQSSLGRRLGRRLDPRLVDAGRLLFFDPILGLHDDNSCAGCHSPAFGFGDSQPIAIGVDNNGVVGPNRKGPRNQRRSPLVANTVFYPALMWTPRFVALSGDPFDGSKGFRFPAPEGVVRGEPTLLAAQGSLPSTELVEMAGFSGITANPGPFGPDHFQFDNGVGQLLPAPDASGFHNFPIQAAIDARLNAIPGYLDRFGRIFNRGMPLAPGGITIGMRRRALAEFQASLTAANAPLDRFARGKRDAMSTPQKRGALLFFGKAGCVACHAVRGGSNEMFSDFEPHRIGGPQLAPRFGIDAGNVIFDGPGRDEDFGFEQTEGRRSLRYAFRTAPLRNLKMAPAFFHNGAFGSLRAAIVHHLDPDISLRNYDARANRVPPDLVPGPFEGILEAGIDRRLRRQARLSNREVSDLVEFVTEALFDPRVKRFCRLVPKRVPSGMPLPRFEGCEEREIR